MISLQLTDNLLYDTYDTCTHEFRQFLMRVACIVMNITAFLCILLLSSVYYRILLLSSVYYCFLLYTIAYYCFPLYTSAFLCILLLSSVSHDTIFLVPKCLCCWYSFFVDVCRSGLWQSLTSAMFVDQVCDKAWPQPCAHFIAAFAESSWCIIGLGPSYVLFSLDVAKVTSLMMNGPLSNQPVPIVSLTLWLPTFAYFLATISYPW